MGVARRSHLLSITGRPFVSPLFVRRIKEFMIFLGDLAVQFQAVESKLAKSELNSCNLSIAFVISRTLLELRETRRVREERE